MQESDIETELKVIVVGNGQVGKTSMITRFARGAWTDSYKKTIGTDFMEKDLFVRSTGETVKLMLWDTAGQEMFSKLTRSYYKGAGAVVYVFSTTDRASFVEMERWKAKVEEECGPIVSVLVQNKTDLLDQAAVKAPEVEDLARRMGCKLYRACVKDNILVSEVFEYLTESFLKSGKQSGAVAVPSITEVANPVDAKASFEAPVPKNGEAFKVKAEPSRQRTGGKKKAACLIQ